MFKKLGVLALLLSSAAVILPSTAYAQEGYYGRRDYYGDRDWNRHERREWRERQERRAEEWRERAWRNHEWREHEWRERERWEHRYRYYRPDPYFYYGYSYGW